jgi:hypothetical protein
VAVIFGLGFATLLTLILVPVLCSLAHGFRGQASKNREQGSEGRAQMSEDR